MVSDRLLIDQHSADLQSQNAESITVSDSASDTALSESSNIQGTPILIPDRRYFTIGEVSELCQVKSHVLRYWEQEFDQLSPVKRKGNRRYYQKNDIILIQEICKLLYFEGFTISGAKLKLNKLNLKSSVSNPITELLDELQTIKTLLS
jgi:DNA-binding transcriptional MerR regulator